MEETIIIHVWHWLEVPCILVSAQGECREITVIYAAPSDSDPRTSLPGCSWFNVRSEQNEAIVHGRIFILFLRSEIDTNHLVYALHFDSARDGGTPLHVEHSRPSGLNGTYFPAG